MCLIPGQLQLKTSSSSFENGVTDEKKSNADTETEKAQTWKHLTMMFYVVYV